MRAYEIVLKRGAIEDLDRLRKYDATQIADAMEKHLTYEPTKESQSRTKRLRDNRSPAAKHRPVFSWRNHFVVYRIKLIQGISGNLKRSHQATWRNCSRD